MNLAYQSFQGLERRLPSKDISESRLLQQIGRQEQRFQELEDRVAELHNQQMEVGDRLGDLETGRCRCRDLVDDGPPTSPESHPVSPSLSAVQGNGDEGGGTVPLGAVEENAVPIPIVVRGQRARRTVRFRLNTQPSSGRDRGIGMSGDSAAFGPSQRRGGGRSSRRRRRGRGGRGGGL